MFQKGGYRCATDRRAWANKTQAARRRQQAKATHSGRPDDAKRAWATSPPSSICAMATSEGIIRRALRDSSSGQGCVQTAARARILIDHGVVVKACIVIDLGPLTHFRSHWVNQWNSSVPSCLAPTGAMPTVVCSPVRGHLTPTTHGGHAGKTAVRPSGDTDAAHDVRQEGNDREAAVEMKVVPPRLRAASDPGQMHPAFQPPALQPAIPVFPLRKHAETCPLRFSSLRPLQATWWERVCRAPLRVADGPRRRNAVCNPTVCGRVLIMMCRKASG